MDKNKYTAEEMRQMAGSIVYERSVEYFPDVEKIAAMLRQAADSMEREESRENKYEYACLGRVFETFNDAMRYAIDTEEDEDSIVRREVGEWEELKAKGIRK